jgi:hypothetical protein
MDNGSNGTNGTNELQDELQRLIQEINRTRTNRNTRSRQSENSDIILLLRELVVSYNLNFREYQENIQFILQIIFLLLNNQQQTTPNSTRNTTRNRFTPINRYRNYNDFVYYYSNPYINNISRQTSPINLFNENVVVAPTQLQIENATSNYNYSSETSEHNTNCPITLDDFQEDEPVTRINHCGHTFRRDAINNWFQRNVRCPVCRFDIRQQPSNNTPNDPPDENTITEEEIYNTIRNSISNSLSEIMDDYYSHSDVSQNLIYTFEFPLLYNDSSNNRIRRNNNNN